jgi:hypothetical protein
MPTFEVLLDDITNHLARHRVALATERFMAAVCRASG